MLNMVSIAKKEVRNIKEMAHLSGIFLQKKNSKIGYISKHMTIHFAIINSFKSTIKTTKVFYSVIMDKNLLYGVNLP